MKFSLFELLSSYFYYLACINGLVGLFVVHKEKSAEYKYNSTNNHRFWGILWERFAKLIHSEAVFAVLFLFLNCLSLNYQNYYVNFKIWKIKPVILSFRSCIFLYLNINYESLLPVLAKSRVVHETINDPGFLGPLSLFGDELRLYI
eukprot:TRINITY_DN10202_c0_g1_i1.p1 TRINITY_DN10202_c0_g1~~TRINITY_DN10202_c0_g1_i1.p1  ORF type:complete len:147 (-),score=5.26 TRINITY_DN10202_c0_g1_i1:130-570(-)